MVDVMVMRMKFVMLFFQSSHMIFEQCLLRSTIMLNKTVSPVLVVTLPTKMFLAMIWSLSLIYLLIMSSAMVCIHPLYMHVLSDHFRILLILPTDMQTESALLSGDYSSNNVPPVFNHGWDPIQTKSFSWHASTTFTDPADIWARSSLSSVLPFTS